MGAAAGMDVAGSRPPRRGRARRPRPRPRDAGDPPSLLARRPAPRRRPSACAGSGPVRRRRLRHPPPASRLDAARRRGQALDAPVDAGGRRDAPGAVLSSPVACGPGRRMLAGRRSFALARRRPAPGDTGGCCGVAAGCCLSSCVHRWRPRPSARIARRAVRGEVSVRSPCTGWPRLRNASVVWAADNLDQWIGTSTNQSPASNVWFPRRRLSTNNSTQRTRRRPVRRVSHIKSSALPATTVRADARAYERPAAATARTSRAGHRGVGAAPRKTDAAGKGQQRSEGAKSRNADP